MSEFKLDPPTEPKPLRIQEQDLKGKFALVTYVISALQELAIAGLDYSILEHTQGSAASRLSSNMFPEI